MGIKGAMASIVLGLLAAAPLSAQDDPDNVATQRDPEDRADAPDRADPSDMDRKLVDPTYAVEPEGSEDISERPAGRVTTVRRTKLGAKPFDSDNPDDTQDVDRDGVDVDGDAPKDRKPKKDDAATKDAAKKEAKKDAPKADAADKKGAAAPAKKKPAGCVDVEAEARFAGVGYDHIVTLKTDCKKPVKCVVRTNVTSDPVSITLPAKGADSVVTWRGSPARVFTPDVTCE